MQVGERPNHMGWLYRRPPSPRVGAAILPILRCRAQAEGKAAGSCGDGAWEFPRPRRIPEAPVTGQAPPRHLEVAAGRCPARPDSRPGEDGQCPLPSRPGPRREAPRGPRWRWRSRRQGDSLEGTRTLRNLNPEAPAGRGLPLGDDGPFVTEAATVSCWPAEGKTLSSGGLDPNFSL